MAIGKILSKLVTRGSKAAQIASKGKALSKANPVIDFLKQSGHTETTLAKLNKVNGSSKANPVIDFLKQSGYTETKLAKLNKVNRIT